jgi:CBS domain-containing protein
MNARDIMVSPVITVAENETVKDVAKLLLAKRISAVPVVDRRGKLVGIVTEADLMRRTDTDTERPTSWWLYLLSGDQSMAGEYAKSHAVRVKDVMTHDVKTATPDTSLHEIVDLFEENNIKRVPIVNNGGDIVGIVSRANILQAVASVRPKLEISLPDTMIRQRLIAELRNQPWAHVRNLNVTVTNGVVDLWGLVQSETERQAIKVAADEIPGVVAVNNRLRCEPVFLY